MSSADWRLRLPRPSTARTELLAALFTTYDQPDAQLLVERVLPELFALRRSPEVEGSERAEFFGELVRRLRRLSGQISVISSLRARTAEGSDASAYPWLWNHVHKLYVGRDGDATQHAKLWLFHWRGDEFESLELVVSSTNLTFSAFRDQLQAGWQALIPLSGDSASNERSWGILPSFLHALGQSTAEPAPTAYFARLLRRCACPDGVSFVASVPGRHAIADLRKVPWGSAGLREMAPEGRGRTRVRMTAPYVGTWSGPELSEFCEKAGCATEDLALVWVDVDHPWVRIRPNWALPHGTRDALGGVGAKLLRLDPTSQFHEQHRAKSDPRWGHAKLYHFKRGRTERLLLTSANFSPAAWGRPGRGTLAIDNFELGVVIEGGKWPLEDLEAFEDIDRAFTTDPAPRATGGDIQWLDAAWDGRIVTVRCRARPECVPQATVVDRDDAGVARGTMVQKAGTDFVAEITWVDAMHPPTRVVVTAEAECACCEVRDLRAPADLTITPFPELGELDYRALADRLLLEAYDLRSVESDPDGIDTGESVESGAPLTQVAHDVADYGVPALRHARALFRVVDAWAARLEKAREQADASRALAWVKHDGQMLLEALRRRANAQGAMARAPLLVAEELETRMAAVSPRRGRAL